MGPNNAKENEIINSNFKEIQKTQNSDFIVLTEK
jgi:hypothetical protein